MRALAHCREAERRGAETAQKDRANDARGTHEAELKSHLPPDDLASEGEFLALSAQLGVDGNGTHDHLDQTCDAKAAHGH